MALFRGNCKAVGKVMSMKFELVIKKNEKKVELKGNKELEEILMQGDKVIAGEING